MTSGSPGSATPRTLYTRAIQCPVCGVPVAEAVGPDDPGPSEVWSSSIDRPLEVFEQWAGSRQGWPTASAQKLLGLLLWATARDRRQLVADVPWSAVRARLLAPEDNLRRYLIYATSAAAADDDPTAAHASRALRDSHYHHQYESWDSSDGLSSDGGPDPHDYLWHGLSLAGQMLDAVLLVERGGWAPESHVAVVTPLGGPAKPATIVRPIWEQDKPDDPTMIDLLTGPPSGYAVRLDGCLDLDVRAASISAAPSSSDSSTSAPAEPENPGRDA